VVDVLDDVAAQNRRSAAATSYRQKKNARRGISHAAHCQPDVIVYFFGNVMR
jgi:hypothetical protein